MASAEAVRFRLGFIGGCLSHQQGIALSALFHRQLDAILRDKENVRLEIRIVRGWDRPSDQRLLTLLSWTELDGFVLHLRVAFVEKAALLLSTLSGGRRVYYLNPGLLDRKASRREESSTAETSRIFTAAEPPRAVEADEDPQAIEMPYKRFLGIRLRDLNLLAGMLLGLDRKAIRGELDSLRNFQRICSERGLPFMVLGPTPSLQGWGEARLWKKMNEVLARQLPEMAIPGFLISGSRDEAGNWLLKGDNYHVNEWGHAFIARGLSGTIRLWAKAKKPGEPAQR